MMASSIFRFVPFVPFVANGGLRHECLIDFPFPFPASSSCPRWI